LEKYCFLATRLSEMPVPDDKQNLENPLDENQNGKRMALGQLSLNCQNGGREQTSTFHHTEFRR
jgi:hypothetical protein